MARDDEWQGPAPGWRPDPWGEGTHRWWDGTQWTGDVSHGDPRQLGRQAGGSAAPTQVLSGSPSGRQPDAPEGGPAESWFGSNWPWLAALLAGLVVGAAIAGLSVGTNTTTEVSAVTETQRETVAKVTTVHDTTTAPAPGPGQGGAAPGVYSGDGEKNLGTIKVPVESVLSWHGGGGTFSIINDPGDPHTIDVASTGTSGSTTVAPGTYHDVDVLALGRWSFTLTPK